ncbi:methyl-accepting chemotaxis protein [Calditerricola satsumensis]|uniref:Methyl-accepting chemotaxis sensory transducer n=1 Tax=Calditerricola satsumensis TaxID=373054 RepID=A0A8J3B7S0_9BACI|nr:methyl-accepting chemotaxis protein [Calditerricola satsumensis]GGK00560.1 methyl-accepting chemotaxis sensory transducer [Calditerricola satsumensis]
MSVKRKLLSIFFLILFLFAAGNAVAWGMLRSVAQDVVRMEAEGQTMTQMMELKAQLRSLSLRVLEYLLDPNPQTLEEYRAQQEAFAAQAMQVQKRLQPEQQVAFQQVLAQYAAFRQLLEERLLPAVQRGDAAEVKRLEKEMTAVRRALIAEIDRLVKAENDQFAAVSARTQANATTTATIQTVVFVLASAVGLTVAVLFTRYLTRPLEQIAAVAQRVAQGDLRLEPLPVRSRDELGRLAQAVNEMVDQLRGMIHNVQGAARQLAASADALSAGAEQTAQAAQEIAQSVQTVASGAESQVRVTEESARAMEEMAAGIQRIAEAMATVEQSAAAGTQTAEEGSRLVQQAIGQMETIAQTVTRTANDVRALADRSQEIETITAVITEIAEQTNLLALNAAIEAARAGEHGRGFSVVADEVRKLAEQAKGSAQEIVALIRGIQEETRQATAAMEATVQEVAAGKEAVRQAGEAFARIASAMHTVNGQVQEVASVSEELSAGSEEVTASVEEVARLAKEASGSAEQAAAATEEQLASMEEMAGSATSLRELAQTLRQTVDAFRV